MKRVSNKPVSGKPIVAAFFATTIVALAVGVGIGALLTQASGDGDRNDVVRRTELIQAFRKQQIELERNFAAMTGPVDASYTMEHPGPPDKSPLVVELLRTTSTAEIRERDLIEKAPETEMELTVLRARNVIALVIGRDVQLLGRVESALDDLN